jgi:hypothetical protein
MFFLNNNIGEGKVFLKRTDMIKSQCSIEFI